MKPLSPTILNRLEYESSRGREPWFIVTAPFAMDRVRPEIVGHQVVLDGELYEVKGVDAHRRDRPIAEGELLGLRVRRAG